MSPNPNPNQARARLLQDAGVLGVLFKGTESTPFDCDDFSGAANLPVGVVGTRDYLALQNLIITHNTSVAWVTGTASPLLTSESFILSYRLLQVLALVLYSYNVWYAVKQLRAFGVLSQKWRRELFLSKDERDPAAKDKGPAVPVISLNLVRPTPLAPLYSAPSRAAPPHHLPPPPRLLPSSPPRAPGLHPLDDDAIRQCRADTRVASQASAPLLLLSPPSWSECPHLLRAATTLGPGGEPASRGCQSKAAAALSYPHRHRPA